MLIKTAKSYLNIAFKEITLFTENEYIIQVLKTMQEALNNEKDNNDNKEYPNNHNLSLNTRCNRDRGIISDNGVNNKEGK